MSSYIRFALVRSSYVAYNSRSTKIQYFRFNFKSFERIQNIINPLIGLLTVILNKLITKFP